MGCRAGARAGHWCVPVLAALVLLAPSVSQAASGPLASEDQVRKAVADLDLGRVEVVLPGISTDALGKSTTVRASVIPVEAHQVLEVDYGKDLRLLDSPLRPEPPEIRTVRRARPQSAQSIDVLIPFRINSHELMGNGPSLLSALAVALREPGREKIRFSVNGHTDTRTGSRAFNMALSKLRAISVMRFLVQQGDIPLTRLEGRAYGPNNPRFSEDTAGGIAANRRVEFELLPAR